MAEPPLTLTLQDETATNALGAALAEALLRPPAAAEADGLVVGLSGDLGAGKTTLVRALLRQAGVTGPVKSPSFALLEPYEVSRLHLYHFDFYRFKNPREFLECGFSELFGPGAVCLVEWPERAGEFLPAADLHVCLRMVDSGRSVLVGANTESGERCLHRLRTLLSPPRDDA
jgi:tRNA threonylcarbamoyladenosine biosynthesis protein TsaE